MERLGPFEPAPRLAIAASGGADSSALALLARDWVRSRGGSLLALVVDHGLRRESAAEAALTADRLAARGIPVRRLHAQGLTRGPALAERARAARYRLLAAACADEGILHLLLGHHALDQAETVMMRALGQSADRGLAGMPALAEQAHLRLLRPLLHVPPQALRVLLREAGLDWIEDPSNRDPRTLRARLRAPLAGNAPAIAALTRAADLAAAARARREAAVSGILAERVTIRPEGFALLSPGPIDPQALAALIQTIGGAPYAPATDQMRALAADPRPATVAGVRLLRAGRSGPGLLLVREAAAMQTAVPAEPGARWDGRFRLAALSEQQAGLSLGALGADSARFRRTSALPAAVLRTLPALRRGNFLEVVPHLLYPDRTACASVRLIFDPPRPLAGAPFCPASTGP
jgi:tRNA(Ile)-lysidine synthase